MKKGNQTPPPRSVPFKRCFFVFLPLGPWFRRACDTERVRPGRDLNVRKTVDVSGGYAWVEIMLVLHRVRDPFSTLTTIINSL